MCLFVVIPVIQRIAPKLSCSREIIRRNSGNNGRIAILFKLEQLTVCPYICTVKCNKDRDIADDLNAIYMCIIANCVPLTEEDELNVLVVFDGISQTLTPCSFNLLIRVTQIIFPLQPACTAVCILTCHEKRIIIQPILFLLTEHIKFLKHTQIS